MILGERVWLRRVERTDLPRSVEGRLRQDRFHGGRYMDTVVMGLLRDELVR